MHGLVNKAIEGFVRDTYDPSTWAEVAESAGLGTSRFEPMLGYDDALTDRVLDAAARCLGKPRETVLEDIGTYLVSHPSVGAPRRLLRFSGNGFDEFLHSLEDLPDRVRLALPELSLPPIRLSEPAAGVVLLECGRLFTGFGHVMAGLVRAMADEYGALATIELIASGAESDTLEVRVHVTRFSAGRDFELGLAEQ